MEGGSGCGSRVFVGICFCMFGLEGVSHGVSWLKMVQLGFWDLELRGSRDSGIVGRGGGGGWLMWFGIP